MMATEKPGTTSPEKPEDQGTRESFNKACKDLWEQDVRTDLIYHKGLMCCQLCLGMFYGSTTDHTHPKKHCIMVSQVCAEKGIGTLENFQRALWQDASTMAKQYGRLILPRMTTQHEDLTIATPVPKESTVNWSQIKIGLLEKELDTVKTEKDKLLAEKRRLEHEVQLLVERLLAEKMKVESIKWRAQSHLESLADLLHPDGCCCTGLCENTSTSKAK